MKKEIGKPVFFVILVVAVAVIGWFGWNSMKTPEERGLNEEAIFRATEQKAKEHGIDLRTVPRWSELYYKYHPDEKKPAASAPSAAAPAMGAVPGASAQNTLPSGQAVPALH